MFLLVALDGCLGEAFLCDREVYWFYSSCKDVKQADGRLRTYTPADIKQHREQRGRNGISIYYACVYILYNILTFMSIF